jgi:hypothetical protein
LVFPRFERRIAEIGPERVEGTSQPRESTFQLRGLPYSVVCSKKAGFSLMKAIDRGVMLNLKKAGLWVYGS